MKTGAGREAGEPASPFLSLFCAPARERRHRLQGRAVNASRWRRVIWPPRGKADDDDRSPLALWITYTLTRTMSGDTRCRPLRPPTRSMKTVGVSTLDGRVRARPPASTSSSTAVTPREAKKAEPRVSLRGRVSADARESLRIRRGRGVGATGPGYRVSLLSLSNICLRGGPSGTVRGGSVIR